MTSLQYMYLNIDERDEQDKEMPGTLMLSHTFCSINV